MDGLCGITYIGTELCHILGSFHECVWLVSFLSGVFKLLFSVWPKKKFDQCDAKKAWEWHNFSWKTVFPPSLYRIPLYAVENHFSPIKVFCEEI